jgi:hypothetical protein
LVHPLVAVTGDPASSGQLTPQHFFGGYGGVVDTQGRLWSVTGGQSGARQHIVRIDTNLPNGHPDLIEHIAGTDFTYQLTLDRFGNVFGALFSGHVQKISPSGVPTSRIAAYTR